MESSCSNSVIQLDYPLQSDHFVVLEEVGSGAFGHVHRCIHKNTSKVMALKSISLMYNTDEENAELQKEINALSKCTSPYITQIYGSFYESNSLCIIMEYVNDFNLSNLLDLHGPLDEHYISIIVRELLKGLEYLHSHELIHRDIKASNILINDECCVKISDFGVCGEITTMQSKLHSFVGTPFWMSPEIIVQDKGYGKKSDIWSLGILVYELATGKPPYWGEDIRKVLFKIPVESAPRLGDGYGEGIRGFLVRCLQKEPRERWSARKLLGHPFISGDENSVLKKLIEGFKQKKEKRKKKKEDKANGIFYWNYSDKKFERKTPISSISKDDSDDENSDDQYDDDPLIDDDDDDDTEIDDDDEVFDDCGYNSEDDDYNYSNTCKEIKDTFKGIDIFKTIKRKQDNNKSTSTTPKKKKKKKTIKINEHFILSVELTAPNSNNKNISKIKNISIDLIGNGINKEDLKNEMDEINDNDLFLSYVEKVDNVKMIKTVLKNNQNLLDSVLLKEKEDEGFCKTFVKSIVTYLIENSDKV